jgi:hypothetical protein
MIWPHFRSHFDIYHLLLPFRLEIVSEMQLIMFGALNEQMLWDDLQLEKEK